MRTVSRIVRTLSPDLNPAGTVPARRRIEAALRFRKAAACDGAYCWGRGALRRRANAKAHLR